MGLEDISTSGLSNDEKAEVESMKLQLAEAGESEDEIRAIIGSFIADCLQASAERR